MGGWEWRGGVGGQVNVFDWARGQGGSGCTWVGAWMRVVFIG